MKDAIAIDVHWNLLAGSSKTDHYKFLTFTVQINKLFKEYTRSSAPLALRSIEGDTVPEFVTEAHRQILIIDNTPRTKSPTPEKKIR